jgi:hypothetical protein
MRCDTRTCSIQRAIAVGVMISACLFDSVVCGQRSGAIGGRDVDHRSQGGTLPGQVAVTRSSLKLYCGGLTWTFAFDWG